MAGFSDSGATGSGTNFLELCPVDFFVHGGEQTCLWNLGTSYRRQALSVCEGSPAQPPRSKGHPRNNDQNGSEECPRSSYHAGRGHPHPSPNTPPAETNSDAERPTAWLASRS